MATNAILYCGLTPAGLRRRKCGLERQSGSNGYPLGVQHPRGRRLTCQSGDSCQTLVWQHATEAAQSTIAAGFDDVTSLLVSTAGDINDFSADGSTTFCLTDSGVPSVTGSPKRDTRTESLQL